MLPELILEICNHYSYLISFLPIALLLVISARSVPASSLRSPQSQYTLKQGDKGLKRAERKEPTKSMDAEKVPINKESESSSSCDPASQQKPVILQGLRRSLSYEEPCRRKVERQGGLVVEEKSFTRGGGDGGHVKPSNMALHVERKPSLTGEEVKELADAFIARVRQRMRAQRQESYKRRRENLERQDSHEIYKARIDRSAG